MISHLFIRSGRRVRLWTGLACLLPCALLAAEKKKTEIAIRPIDPVAAAQVSYTRDIKPLFLNQCVECHSAEDKKSDYDLSTVPAMLKAGKKGTPGVIPGKPDESSLVLYIRGLAEGPQMPKGSDALTADELHLVRQWIAAGAKDDSGEVKKSVASANGAMDAATQELFNTLLFESQTAQEKLVLIRNYRISQLPPAPAVPETTQPTANAIDRFIIAKWAEANLPEAKTPPPLCSDATFVRRVYLDLIGRTPSAESAEKFVTDTAPDKRAKLIEKLLSRHDDYAAHWTPFWEDALCSATADITGGIGSRGNHREWIYNSFKTNKPFDIFAAELIDPAMPGYRQPRTLDANGKKVISAYIKNETHEEVLQTASNVGQVFLGTGMKCASCHSHFLNKEWPQARFLAFGGMLSPNDLEMIRCEKRSGQIIPAKFPFELPGYPEETPKELKARLHRSALMLVDPRNPRFAKTIVNRLWKRYVGLGLFEPIDDFRLDQPPSHPQFLDWLADDFIRNGYDVQHTVRLILNSRTYQLAYNPKLADQFDVQKPTDPRYFRSPSLRRLTAEQYIDSIRGTLAKNWGNTNRIYLDKSSGPLDRALGKPASHAEVSTGRADDVAVVQSLELLNGEEMHGYIYNGDKTAAFAAAANETQAITNLYWLTLSRPPSPAEKALAEKFLPTPVATGTTNAANREAYGDLLWALFVSPEFQYIR